VATQPKRAEEGSADLDVGAAVGGGATVAPQPLAAGAQRTGERRSARAERRSLAGRAVAFLRACWAELQRMQWPDREHTAQATAVVLGFVIVAGIYLAIADLISQKIVNLIF